MKVRKLIKYYISQRIKSVEKLFDTKIEAIKEAVILAKQGVDSKADNKQVLIAIIISCLALGIEIFRIIKKL